MRNLLLSNVNVNSIVRKLGKNYDFQTSDGYNGWIPYVFNELSSTAENFQNIFILLDGNELKRELNLEFIAGLLNKIKEIALQNNTSYFWLSDLYMQRLEIAEDSYATDETFRKEYFSLLISVMEGCNNIRLFTIRKLVEILGPSNFFSPKMWYLASIKFSAEGENAIINYIENIINYKRRKKCLALDMDNTLWGGVIGEVGFENIDIGLCYSDFQRRLKEIKEKGTILIAVTKNDYEDAVSAFQNKNMVLQKEDFAYICANWSNKAENIVNIIALLNIGMESVVFVDDNPIERENIRINLPDIVVPEFPYDITRLNEFAIDLYDKYFYNPFPVEEDKKKTRMYQDNMLRETIKMQCKDISEYIKQLNITVRFKRAMKADLLRVSELSNKTNQYNTSVIRYSENELDILMDNPQYHIYIAEISDRIGDNGLCIACIIRYNTEIATIENFFMSCRIMGRKIENAFFENLVRRLKKLGIRQINGKYVPNGKNIPAKDFFISNGFKADASVPDGQFYLLNIDADERKGSEIIKIIEVVEDDN